ncbi:MAG: ribonuclease III [Clostridia bacterium]|nr:ribonuclease III [Clostridia bacterium]
MDFSQISVCALAYLGDAVIETLVREHLVLKGYEKSGKLNDEARKFITAVNQSAAYLKIQSLLEEKEADIFRRARNSSHLNIPKSASAQEYKNATGFEAVFGYLRLQKNEERIKELFALAYADIL